MKAPIFILCVDGDLLVYKDPARALQYVESPDVEGGEYLTVFDAEGRRFTLVVLEPTKLRTGWFMTSVELTPVAFHPMEETATGADELRSLLCQRLPNADRCASLEELVRTAAETLPSP